MTKSVKTTTATKTTTRKAMETAMKSAAVKTAKKQAKAIESAPVGGKLPAKKSSKNDVAIAGEKSGTVVTTSGVIVETKRAPKPAATKPVTTILDAAKKHIDPMEREATLLEQLGFDRINLKSSSTREYKRRSDNTLVVLQGSNGLTKWVLSRASQELGGIGIETFEVGLTKLTEQTAVSLKANEQKKADEQRAAERAANPVPDVNGAIKALAGRTIWKYDPSLLSDDKDTKHRVSILKKLTGKETITDDESEPVAFCKALYAALKAEGKGKAITADFVAKAKKLVADLTKAKKAAEKAEAAMIAKQPREQVSSTPPLPTAKPLTKAEQKEQMKSAAAEVRASMRLNQFDGPMTRPDGDCVVVVEPDGVRLLEDASNGLVLMQVEKSNSQGAVCVYNNGQRVSAGVVPSATLATLRVMANADLHEAARQLLSPITVGLPISPAAARHLNAVLHCKELVMATKKKFEAPKSTSKKSATAPAAKSAKAAKSTEPKERATSTFRLQNGTKKEWEAFTGQKGDIVKAFVKAGAVGAKAVGMTRGALIAALPNIGPNNISFYLSKWQTPGIVEKLAAVSE